MPLLDGLARVAWSELSHAYGAATDVPDLLRALADEGAASPALRRSAERSKKTVRAATMEKLWGNVFHQGTRWQVTSHVVPFLVEILRDGPADAALRGFLLTYLHHIAYGYPADLFPLLIAPSRDQSGDVDEKTRYAVDCFNAVESALPAVAPFARDPNDNVALPAIALLGGFVGDVARAALRDALEVAEPRRRAIGLVALAQLDDATREMAMPLLEDADRIVAVHAACAVLLANPQEVPTAAVDVLVHPLGELVETPSPLTDTLGALVSRCLEMLPVIHRSAAIRALAGALATSSVTTNLAMTASLLRIAMPERAPGTARELTPDQRVALDAVAAHGAFKWRFGAFGNYASLLRAYQLPTTADELRAWLGVG